MKHMKLVMVTGVLIFALSLAGCGNSKGEQAADSGTSVNSQSENQAGDTGASDDGGENSTNLDNLVETASLRGSVADFQDGSFQVVPDQDDGQIAKSAAEGMESGMESTTVSYHYGFLWRRLYLPDCQHQQFHRRSGIRSGYGFRCKKIYVCLCLWRNTG